MIFFKVSGSLPDSVFEILPNVPFTEIAVKLCNETSDPRYSSYKEIAYPSNILPGVLGGIITDIFKLGVSILMEFDISSSVSVIFVLPST